MFFYSFGYGFDSSLSFFFIEKGFDFVYTATIGSSFLGAYFFSIFYS